MANPLTSHCACRSIDRERVRQLLDAAQRGIEYSVIEMASDLAHALEVNDRLAADVTALENTKPDLGAAHEHMAGEVAAAHGALLAIFNALGGGRINWEPNYPEVQHALKVAQEALR